MKTYSTREAAKQLGVTQASLSRYIAAKKIPTPETVTYGKFRVHVWSKEDIERVRALLPKIANGRKTRYQKKHSAVKAEPKKKSAQPRAAVPHKNRKGKTAPKRSKP